MTIYLAGSGADIFSGSNIVEKSSTITGIQTSLYASSTSPQYKAYFLDPSSRKSTTLSTFWANIYFSATGSNSSSAAYPDGFVFLSPDGSAIYIDTVSFSTGSVVVYQRTSAGVRTQLGSAFAISLNTNISMDVNIVGLGTSSGSVSIYINGVKIFSYSGSLSAVTAVSSIEVSCLDGQVSSLLNSVIVSDEITIGAYISKQMPSTEGTYQDWTGTFTDIATIPLDTTKYIYASEAEKLETAKASSETIDETKYTLAAVVVSSIISNTSTTLNTSHVAVYNGTKYSYNLDYVVGQVPQYSILNTAPDGTTWSTSDLNEFEYGIETINYDSTAE